MTIEWIGYLAAICTTFSFIPQVLHILRTRDTHAISLGMYSIFTIGIALWMVYGVMLKNLPMMIANSITLTLALFILGFKVYQQFFKHKSISRNDTA